MEKIPRQTSRWSVLKGLERWLASHTKRDKKNAFEIAKQLAKDADVGNLLDLQSRIFWEDSNPGVTRLVPDDIRDALKQFDGETLVPEETLEVNRTCTDIDHPGDNVSLQGV